MTTPFEQAVALHRAGRLDTAEHFYRAALADRPDHLESRYNLATLMLQTGRPAESLADLDRILAQRQDLAPAHNARGLALRLLGRLDEAAAAHRAALALNPRLAEAHNNLGIALAQSGRPAEAVPAFQAALALRPDHAETWNNLGIALAALPGRGEEALAAYRTALTHRPDYAEALNNRGILLSTLGRPEEAVESWQRAVAAHPAFPPAMNNLGIGLRKLGRLGEALDTLRAVLAQAPDFAEAHANLSVVLTDLGRAEEGAHAARTALALKPGYPEAHINLGNALADLGRLKEAIAAWRDALALAPERAEAHSNIGAALARLGQSEEAVAAARTAVALAPDFAEAHGNLSFALLITGALAEGWREYEWRWRVKSFGLVPRDFPQPRWSGEDLNGRTLLLAGEQGLGDQIQFARFATLCADRGGRVVLEVDRSLVRLLATVPGVAATVATGDPPPAFDCHLPMMSAPLVLGTALDTIPAAIPYVRPEAAAVARWAERLSGLAGLRVGLVWAGNPRLHDPRLRAIDRRRSIALTRLAPLFALPHIAWVSLQKGTAAAERMETHPAPPLFDPMDEVADFADTAALIANLDLVISVDTSVVHLAGALGKPVWLLSRFDGCWRWLVDRDDSPWYPTLRLYRQPAPDAWEAVIACILPELAQRAAARALDHDKQGSRP